MCPPAVILGVVALVGSAATAIGQYQQAKHQNKAAGQLARDQQEEATAQRDQQVGERVAQARRDRATLQVAGGEAGIGGASLEAALRDSFGRQNQDIAVAQKQGGFTHRAIINQAASSRARFSPALAGLQIAGSAASAYGAAGGFDRAPPAPIS